VLNVSEFGYFLIFYISEAERHI